MEIPNETKYQKLAQEYSKLRAQATVLKRALLDEQEERAHLKEELRQQQASQRRAEQENDSLGFRNMQLEHRVAVLQEELRKGHKKDHHKRSNRTDELSAQGNIKDITGVGAATVVDNTNELAQDAIIFEELQKKIMVNAQLTTLMDERERDLQLHAERIVSLEKALQKQSLEHNELEQRLRHDIDTMRKRNAELETKIAEAISTFGSEDALSVSKSEITSLQPPYHKNTLTHSHTSLGDSGNITKDSTATQIACTSTERIALLEKEVILWRTQCELVQLENEPQVHNNSTNKCNSKYDVAHGCSSSAAGFVVQPNSPESKSKLEAHSNNTSTITTTPKTSTREQHIFNRFSEKYEDLLKRTREAESCVQSYRIETENLQNCLDDATTNINAVKKNLNVIEEDLATTRVNYEEQISVLTEQVISLSEQLAACK